MTTLSFGKHVPLDRFFFQWEIYPKVPNSAGYSTSKKEVACALEDNSLRHYSHPEHVAHQVSCRRMLRRSRWLCAQLQLQLLRAPCPLLDKPSDANTSAHVSSESWWLEEKLVPSLACSITDNLTEIGRKTRSRRSKLSLWFQMVSR